MVHESSLLSYRTSINLTKKSCGSAKGKIEKTLGGPLKGTRRLEQGIAPLSGGIAQLMTVIGENPGRREVQKIEGRKECMGRFDAYNWIIAPLQLTYGLSFFSQILFVLAFGALMITATYINGT